MADDTEQLFLRTVSDLQSSIQQADWYKLIKATGLLRLLLLDGSPLVHLVNAKYRLRLRFELIPPITLPGKPLFQFHNVDPSICPAAKTITTDMQGFLGTRCLTFKQHEYTVADIVRAGAHLKGGVHFGKAKKPAEGALLALDEVSRIGGLVPSLAGLKGIIRVTCESLQPLVHAIEKP